jgi:hypothetical protein
VQHACQAAVVRSVRNCVANAELKSRVTAGFLVPLRKNGVQISGFREKFGVGFEICVTRTEQTHYEAIERFQSQSGFNSSLSTAFFGSSLLLGQFYFLESPGYLYA